MNLTTIFAVGLPVLFLCVIFIAMYNSLVAVKNHCEEAWANIDTELKRRHDLIPNLIATVKGYAEHEKELLTSVSQLREASMREHQPSSKKAELEGKLAGAVHSLMVRMEAYPELKAGANFLQLQEELVNTEDRIQAALRFYNGNVRENNMKLSSFPSNLVAGMFNFESRNYFEIKEPGFRATPKVSF